MILILSSIVKLEIITDPVPPGSSLISALELDPMILSLNVKLSIVTVPAKVVAPVTVKLPKVASPSTPNVPVVLKFSFPKLIDPPESVIVPFVKVRFPRLDPVAADIVSVVVKLSLPKLIAPELSVIVPFAKVKFPNVDPVAAETVPVIVAAPDVDIVPSTINPSLMLMLEESSEDKLVPSIFIDPSITLPVPLGTKFILSLDLVPSMLLPFILSAGNTIDPVPEGANSKSSLLLVAVIEFPLYKIVSLVTPGAA